MTEYTQDPSSSDALEDGRYDSHQGMGLTITGGETRSTEWVDLARRSWRKSDDWFDSAVRSQVEDSLRAFNSEHPAGSKYYSTAYEKRTKLFRPRTRGNMRKLEAAFAVANFSTTDAVSVEAFDRGNKKSAWLANIKESLIRRRIAEKKFFWYTTAMSAFQSGLKERVAIGHVGWDYDTDSFGNVISDRPFLDVVPLELFRVDPGADFRDMVNTSPYVIHRMPFYLDELMMGMREGVDGSPPRYLPLTEQQLLTGANSDYDSIRTTRERRREDRYGDRTGNRSHQTIWVDHVIMHKDGHDWVYDVVGETHLLTEPKRIEDVYRFCKTKDRPYVMGSPIIEAFSPYPMSPVEIGLPMQEEINELGNLSIDAVNLNTTPRYFVRRGSAMDVQTFLRSSPGSVIYTNDPDKDVKESGGRNIPSGIFQERDRLASEMDDLNGTFMGSSVGMQRRLNETVGGMNLLNDNQNQVQEFTLRTFVESWTEPALNMVMRAIEAYETDERLMMAVAGEKQVDLADVYESLLVESVTQVSVGFGNTNPQKRMERFQIAASTTAAIMGPQFIQQIDQREMVSEIWGAAGFRDGSRFFPSLMQNQEEDPRIQQLQQQLAEAQQFIEMDRAKAEVKLQETQIKIEGQLRLEQVRQQGLMQIAQLRQEMEGFKEQNKVRLEWFDRQIAESDNERETQRLRNEREALSHSISMAERQFAWELKQYFMNAAQQRQQMAMDQQAQQPAPSQQALPSPQSNEFAGVPNQARDLISSLRKPGSGKSVELGEPINLPGNDFAGTIARGDYGNIPGQAG